MTYSPNRFSGRCECSHPLMNFTVIPESRKEKYHVNIFLQELSNKQHNQSKEYRECNSDLYYAEETELFCSDLSCKSCKIVCDNL